MNFFPVAKDIKIEIYSKILNINKSDGTGYEMVSNEIKSKDEKANYLNIKLIIAKVFSHFNLLTIYFKKRFKRIP